MFSHIAQTESSDEIVKRIGEQKIIISNIYAILNKLEHIAYYRELKKKLDPLKTVYNEVKISYVYREPVMKEVNGELVIEDASESLVEISPANMKQIHVEIKKLRDSIFVNYK